ncbi:MAG: hypothetical protein AUJ85_02925 [Elusimicrobia bacterium CG1_02_37_114]|nr:MAG: hypothetical protein AUJ85_02925 [Elusimicrobia bacterium CG1_02_37_114]PIV52693.1 MAG: PIN domain nuclease [Elusimicrobia bacterium CG02_land_8_20_14_3_00_37_13]PIZ13026.1 MAG: PIN domain nuclease [Elusimicrobia bacterium CG_4_10_14_0_8_um_filter_37_32]
MKKLKYYIETSVFNFVFADDEPSRRDLTKYLFQKVQGDNVEIYISEVVITEINDAPEDIKNKLLSLIKKYKPYVIPIDEETKLLANKYISEGIIPEKFIADALHIAVTSVNDLDVIISWNFKHIVKLKTKIEANGVNKLLGYKEIEICTPEEVVES